MLFSFLLCTNNRKDLLRIAVLSILNQRYKEFEIVIVDQSDVPDWEITVMSNKIVYIHSEVKGLSKARNLGLRYTKGDYICLMDDDAEYEQNALFNARYRLESQKIDIISGRIIDKSGIPAIQGMDEQEKIITKKNFFSCCMSPSLILSRNFLNSTNNFDENLGVGEHWGAGEESDFILRSLYQSAVIKYIPEILVYHPSSSFENLTLERVKHYNLGFGALYCKHLIIYKNKIMFYFLMRGLIRKFLAIGLGALTIDKKKFFIYLAGLLAILRGFYEYYRYGVKSNDS